MRTLIFFFFGLISLTTFGQKEVRKAYIIIDGKETSYKDYKKLDLTKFASITVLAKNDENARLFGKNSKKGIVHLRTKEFDDNLKKLLGKLRNEFDENRVETTLFVINGVPYDRTQFQKDKLAKLDYGTIEWIVVPDDTGILNHNKVIIIQTNVEI